MILHISKLHTQDNYRLKLSLISDISNENRKYHNNVILYRDYKC